MRYEVTMGDVVLDQTRRLNGALNILASHVESRQDHLRRHSHPGDRVVSGPDRLADGEYHAEAVVLMTHGVVARVYRYAIRRRAR